MSRDKKAKFRNDTQEFRGMDLREKMVDVCSQEIQSCTYLDSEDLAEKYRNNPVILESILTNAKRLLCPTRGVWLYEDRSKMEALADNCVCPNCKCIINVDRQYQSRHNARESRRKNEHTRLYRRTRLGASRKRRQPERQTPADREWQIPINSTRNKKAHRASGRCL